MEKRSRNTLVVIIIIMIIIMMMIIIIIIIIIIIEVRCLVIHWSCVRKMTHLEWSTR